MRHDDQPIEVFTAREQDILGLLVDGLSNDQMVERLVLSRATVKWYVKQIYRKLDAHNREQAVARARDRGFGKQAEALDIERTNPGVRYINPLPQDVSIRYIGYKEKNVKLIELLNQHAKLISVNGRAGSGKTGLACKVLAELKNNQELE